MTKDPYTPLTRLISHAEERVVTEPEYCWKLIPAKDVQIKQVKVYQSIQPRQLRKLIFLLTYLFYGLVFFLFSSKDHSLRTTW